MLASNARHLPTLARQVSRLAVRSASSSAILSSLTNEAQMFPGWSRQGNTQRARIGNWFNVKQIHEAACVTPCETGCPPETLNSHNHHNCWNCNKEKKRHHCSPDLFCDGCGVMLPIPRGTNFFELMGIETETYTVDTKALDARYKQMMAKMHPDKFMQKSKTEQELSATQCSEVNAAYSTLRCPHKRAVYMLRRLGFSFEDATSATDPEFMMDVMEASTEVQEAGRDQEAISRVRTEFYEPQMETNCRQAAEAFARQDVLMAAEVTARLQYLQRLGKMIREKQDIM